MTSQQCQSGGPQINRQISNDTLLRCQCTSDFSALRVHPRAAGQSHSVAPCASWNNSGADIVYPTQTSLVLCSLLLSFCLRSYDSHYTFCSEHRISTHPHTHTPPLRADQLCGCFSVRNRLREIVGASTNWRYGNRTRKATLYWDIHTMTGRPVFTCYRCMTLLNSQLIPDVSLAISHPVETTSRR